MRGVRALIKILIPLAVIAVLAVGLLPPLFARGSLDTDAVNAAKAASSVFAGSGARSGPDAAIAAARNSLSGDPGVTIVSITFPKGEIDTVQVTLSKTVHTFMDGFPGLKSWFHVTSTQSSQLGA